MYRFLPAAPGGEADRKQEIDRNCLLVRGARRVVGAFFALTKKQLLFCFPLFSC
jgi:hypothetical protein